MSCKRIKLVGIWAMCLLLIGSLLAPGSAFALDPVDRSETQDEMESGFPVWMTSVMDWLNSLLGSSPAAVTSSPCPDGCTSSPTEEPAGSGSGGETQGTEDGGTESDPDGDNGPTLEPFG